MTFIDHTELLRLPSVHRTPEAADIDTYQRVRAAILADPAASDQAIARRMRVGRSYVADVRAALVAEGTATPLPAPTLPPEILELTRGQRMERIGVLSGRIQAGTATDAERRELRLLLEARR